MMKHTNHRIFTALSSDRPHSTTLYALHQSMYTFQILFVIFIYIIQFIVVFIKHKIWIKFEFKSYSELLAYFERMKHFTYFKYKFLKITIYSFITYKMWMNQIQLIREIRILELCVGRSVQYD